MQTLIQSHVFVLCQLALAVGGTLLFGVIHYLYEQVHAYTNHVGKRNRRR